MADTHPHRNEHSIKGISLPSFLQLLGQEKKSCTLVVKSEEGEGRLFFQVGEMIDAEQEGTFGLEAAYSILGWDNTTYHLEPEEQRIQRISQSLPHIVLTASTLKDEQPSQQGSIRPTSPPPNVSPACARLIQHIIQLPGLQHYFLLDKQGKIISQSKNDPPLCDLIAYTIVNGRQMLKSTGAKGLHNIRILFADNTMLLIIPSKAITIALILHEKCDLTEVFRKLRELVTQKKKTNLIGDVP